MPHTKPLRLKTGRGEIQLPAYIPVTTFGKKYPLDDLVRPYLPRLAQAVMVSYHYARQAAEWPSLPLMIDSGGFASLFSNARIITDNKLGCIEIISADGEKETLHPRSILEFQEAHADIAFSLDFPIPPGMNIKEARHRQILTIINAKWAIANRRRRDMLLFACVQGWDINSFEKCAKELCAGDFDGFAIGGLVPRARDEKLVLEIVRTVRRAIPDKPLHVFGLGKPALVRKLFGLGVDSIDSSSYVQLAADGRLWGSPAKLSQLSPTARLHLALCNLATAGGTALPLGMADTLFRTAIAMGHIQSEMVNTIPLD